MHDEEEAVDYDFESPAKPPRPTQDQGPVEDIYGDLYGEDGEGETLLKSKYAALEEKYKILEASLESIRQQLHETTQERDALREEKRILVRNISCLYKTAKEDVQRLTNSIKMKNEELLRLQLQVKTRQSPVDVDKQMAAARHRSPSVQGQSPSTIHDARRPISPDFGNPQARVKLEF